MYFNHAFRKVFLGTKNATVSTPTNPNQSSGTFTFASGFITGAAGTYGTNDLIATSTTVGADNLGIGSFGFFTTDTYTNVNTAWLSSHTCCPLVLAATALYQKDKIGPFAGGYQESNKSKVINPKYVSRFIRVDSCASTQNIQHVGNTPFTAAQSPGAGCCFEFLCDQSYTLRLDIKGSPVLRFLDHNAYYESSTWTGCCPANTVVPTAVDPTIVYIKWAKDFINSPIVSPFLEITVYDQTGTAVGAANDVTAWDAYTAQPVVACTASTPGAGMKLVGAYVDTKFSDCTFYPTDFFEKEPVHLYLSLVDLTGDVCAFTGICVTQECCGKQGNGFGETVLRDLILSERYLQNDFYTGRDLRIREITQGYDVTSAIDRTALYTRYIILHNVPRFNNPTGVFDNDQYMLEIITNGRDTNLETFVNTWLTNCNGPCPGLEVVACQSGC